VELGVVFAAELLVATAPRTRDNERRGGERGGGGAGVPQSLPSLVVGGGTPSVLFHFRAGKAILEGGWSPACK